MMQRFVPVLALALLSTIVTAQEFPNRAVRIVVPWPPSGNVDITARTIAPALGEALGQQVIVENRAGAGGTIGSTAVVKSPADGYTLLLGSSGTVTVAPAVFKTIAYDPLKDLTTIGAIQFVPLVLTAATKTPVATFAEFVAYSRTKPGQVSIASAGNGSSNHLAIELLMRQAKLQLVHVPYKGSGPAITDLLGSQVETMMDQLNASIGHIRDGPHEGARGHLAQPLAVAPERADAGRGGRRRATRRAPSPASSARPAFRPRSRRSCTAHCAGRSRTTPCASASGRWAWISPS